MADLTKLMTDCIAAIKTGVQKTAEAEREYRKAKAEAWVRVKSQESLKLSPEKQAWVEAETADKRYKRDLAQGMVQALLEENRNLRQQMSWEQTRMNSERMP